MTTSEEVEGLLSIPEFLASLSYRSVAPCAANGVCNPLSHSTYDAPFHLPRHLWPVYRPHHPSEATWHWCNEAAYFQHLRLPAAQLDDFSDSPVTLAELREYTRSRLLRPVVRLLQLLDAGSQGQDGQRLAQFPFLASAPAPFASAFSPLPPFLLYTAPWRAAAVIEVVGGRSAGFSGHQSEASCLFDWFEPEETSVSVMPPETLLLRWSIHRMVAQLRLFRVHIGIITSHDDTMVLFLDEDDRLHISPILRSVFCNGASRPKLHEIIFDAQYRATLYPPPHLLSLPPPNERCVALQASCLSVNPGTELEDGLWTRIWSGDYTARRCLLTSTREDGRITVDASTQLSHDAPATPLTMKKLLSSGRIGQVYECELNGVRVAVKFCTGKTETAYLAREVALYEGPLASLQGGIVPHCYGYFTQEDSNPPHALAVLELCGAHLASDSIGRPRPRRPNISEYERNIITQQYHMLEDHGVIHGDIRAENILHATSPPTDKPAFRIVDFHLAKLKPTKPDPNFQSLR